MSRQAKISLMGLTNWNDGLFDLLVIPEGLNKDTFTDNLVTETAELEVLYPNYEVMRTLIGVWSHKMLPVWQHLYDTTMYEYDPIQNYNRTEIETINGEGNRVHSGTDRTATSGTDTTTNSGTDTTALSGTDRITDGGSDVTTHGGQNSHNQTTTNTDNNRHSIAGFDSVPSNNNDGLVLSEVDDLHKTEIVSGSETFGKTETLQHGKTEQIQHGTTEQLTHGKIEQISHGKIEQLTHGEQIADTNESTRENHTSGNIGVTTTQKMIREEREIAEFNIYDRMIKDFMDRFCIMVF